MSTKIPQNDNNVALTVDIEDWYHLRSVTGLPSSRFRDVPSFFTTWNNRYDYLSVPTMQVLDLLQELKIRATFFIVADVIIHYPDLVKKIAERGHEIACHGLHHACKIDPKTKKPLVTENEFIKMTIQAKEMLERASGQEVIGYRAPNAFIAGWMIDVLEKIGFLYDSSVSVNFAYNKTDSRLRNVDTRAYYPAKRTLEPGLEKRSIIEIPWPYFQFLVKFPTGGGPVLRLFGANYIMRGLRESLTRGDTVFYFHPLDIGEENYPFYTSLVQRLLWTIKDERVLRRTKYILGNIQHRTTTCRELIQSKGLLDEMQSRIEKA